MTHPNNHDSSDGQTRRKVVGYTELEWVCPNCSSRNKGSVKLCTSCGGAQPPDVQFVQPAQAELITDKEKIAEIKQKKPDVHCPFCGTRNSADAKTCSRCMGDLSSAEKRVSGQSLGAQNDKPAPDLICPSCGTTNPANTQKCPKCGTPLPLATPKPVAQVAPKSKGNNTALFIALGVILLLGICVYFAFIKTDKVIGTVSNVSWTRTVTIMGYAPSKASDWIDEIPQEGNILNCDSRVRQSQPDPEPGYTSKEVCTEKEVIDQGTGFGTIIEECYYEIYDDWCSYSIMTWQAVGVVKENGDDFNAFWPTQLNLKQGQEAGGRAENYEIDFEADGKEYQYETNDYQIYQQADEIEHWILEINGVGDVVSITPDQ